MPEPEIKESDGGILVTLFKDSFSEEHLIKLGLNDRQIKAVLFLKENDKMTSKDYQMLSGDITDRTALRDIEQLIDKNLIVKIGQKKGTYYRLSVASESNSNVG